MNIDYSKKFDKQFTKLRLKEQQHALAKTALFIKNQQHESLRNHALKGEWAGYRSISVGGDLRIHFKELSGDTVLFVAIGSHAQLYK